MLGWSRIIGFDWDAGNARKNLGKHGVEQSEAEEAFFNRPLIVAQELRHSRTEPRYHALGVTNPARRLHITFTIRGGGALLRLISARDMSPKERKNYASRP
jgi:uncharacterized protein